MAYLVLRGRTEIRIWCVQCFFPEGTSVLQEVECVDDDLFCDFDTGEDGRETEGRDAFSLVI